MSKVRLRRGEGAKTCFEKKLCGMVRGRNADENGWDREGGKRGVGKSKMEE